MARSRSRSKSPRRDKKDKKDKRKKSKRHKDKNKDKSHNEPKEKAPTNLVSPEREVIQGGADETMSTAQMNALRASLGLEPLAAEDETVGDEDDKIMEAEKKRRDDIDAQKDQASGKRAKDLKKRLEGNSISEMYKDKVGASAADWVKRSRKIGHDKALAAFRAATLDEQEEQEEYDTGNLAGLKVAHNSDQFSEGTGVILTLKDKYILQDGQLEMEEDILENVNMVDNERDEKNNKTRAQKTVYDAFDEENNTELLPQYGDDKEKNGIRLTGQEDEGSRKAAAIRAKLKRSLPKDEEFGEDDHRRGKTAYDLEFEKNHIPSDFLPTEFKKKKMRKKKKTIRKATGDEDVKRADPLAHIPVPDVQAHMADHSSRDMDKRASQDAEKKAKAQNLKDKGYLRALHKAEQESRRKLEELEHVFEEEDDAELQASMERARRLSQQKKEEKAKKRAKKMKKEEDMLDEEEEEEEEEKHEDAASRLAKTLTELATVKEEEGEEGVIDDKVFTATTEFCRGLEQVMAEKKDAAAESGFNEVTDAKKDKKDEKKKEKKKAINLEDDEDRDSDNMKDESDEEDDSEDEQFGADEPRADHGIAEALQLAKRRGLLKDKIAQAGRSKDTTATFDDPAPHISLQYLDEFGRPMKPKEAFRKLSHTFHGRGPGMVKLEKRLKQFKEEQRRGAIFAGRRQTTLEKLEKRKNKSGQAYVVLDQKSLHDKSNAKK